VETIDGARRWLLARPFMLDALLALGLWAVDAISIHSYGTTLFRDVDLEGFLLAAPITLAVAFRRRFPMLAFLVSATFLTALTVAGYPNAVGPFATLVILYSVAAHRSRLLARAALALTSVCLVLILLSDTPDFGFGDFLVNHALFVASWLLGRSLQSRRAQTLTLATRNAELESAREQLAAQAVAEERLRIARELHDIVAHSLSVIAVQSAVGRHVLASQPEEAGRSLAAIEATSKSALTEVRRMLGVLRSDDRDPELAPLPGLGQLERLVGEVRSTGLEVDLLVEGVRRELPAGVDLAAYRITQEALTNTIRHAGPAHASVAVRYEPDEVVVEVLDDGRGLASTRDGDGDGDGGHGLLGMRERAALCGGELDAGPRRGGGFRVWARLPYEVGA
jgi:signal transduction histidine kinase